MDRAEPEESGSPTVEPPAPVRPSEASHESDPRQETELDKAQAEITRQHALFKKAVEECERLTANATHVQAELKSFRSDRQQLKADATQTRQVILAAEARAAELEEALVAAQQENAALRQQIETDVAGLNQQLSAREHDLQERTSELGHAVRTYARTKSDLSTSVIEATGLRTELHASQRDFRAAAEQLAIAEPQLRETKARLEALTEEHRLASEQREEWRQRAEGFEHDLTSIDSGRDLLEVRAQLQKLQVEHRTLETAFAERTEEAQKNNDALRGIIARQNTTLGVYHSEVRRLRRARFTLRLVYGLFATGLVTLGFIAFKVFAPHHFAEFFSQFTTFFRH